MRRAQAAQRARLRAHLVGASASTKPGFAQKFSPEYMEELAREAVERTKGSGSLEERVAVQWFGQKTPLGDGVGVGRFAQRIRDLGLARAVSESAAHFQMNSYEQWADLSSQLVIHL